MERDHLRVGGRIRVDLFPIVPPPDDHPTPHGHCPDRYIAVNERPLRFEQRQTHPGYVVHAHGGIITQAG